MDSPGVTDCIFSNVFTEKSFVSLLKNEEVCFLVSRGQGRTKLFYPFCCANLYLVAGNSKFYVSIVSTTTKYMLIVMNVKERIKRERSLWVESGSEKAAQ
jgi:hypothetical protein